MAQKVLVVADDRRTREWLIWHLKTSGCLAAGVADGDEAFKVVNSKTLPDIVIVDLDIAKMGGIDFLKRLRAHAFGKKIPVIVITEVYKGNEYEKKTRELFHVQSYLDKPFTIESLLDELRKIPVSAPQPQPQAEPAAPKSQPLARITLVSQSQASASKREHGAPASGNLSQYSFDSLLLQFWKEHLTGKLKLTVPEDDGTNIAREFAFLGGRPVFARSNAAGEDFGSYLVSRGIATPDENREYLARQSSSIKEPEEIFIGMGCLTPDGFIVERVHHLEELLIGCFTHNRGEYIFEPSDLETAAVAGANVPRILHEGYRRHLSENKLGIIFSKLAGKYLCRTEKFYVHLQSMELDEAESKFVDEIAGSKMLKDHAEKGNFHKILKTTAALLALGMIEDSRAPRMRQVAPPFPIRPVPPIMESVCAAKDAPAAAPIAQAAPQSENMQDLGEMLSDELGDLADELSGIEMNIPAQITQVNEEHKRLEEDLKKEADRLKGKNYYEFFNAKLGHYKFDDIKKTYFEKRKLFSPENYIGWASGELISLAEDVFSQLNSAYNTLSSVVSKEKYDELLQSSLPKVSGDRKQDRFQAQVQFESGKAFIEMKEYSSAEQSFREAVDLNPNIAAYYAWLGWSIYSNNPQIQTNVTRALKEIAASIKVDPRCDAAFAFRGSILLDQGELDRAEVELRRALQFNPKSKFARQKIQSLQTRREAEKKGLFGRMFS